MVHRLRGRPQISDMGRIYNQRPGLHPELCSPSAILHDDHDAIHYSYTRQHVHGLIGLGG